MKSLSPMNPSMFTGHLVKVTSWLRITCVVGDYSPSELMKPSTSRGVLKKWLSPPRIALSFAG